MDAREPRLDELDRDILDCYRENPNITAAAIGDKVKLSENAVRDRTKKLISAGILAFAATIDYDRVSSFSLEAYVEISFPGDLDVHATLRSLVSKIGRREIREAITLVGDVDAMVRIRARNVVQLRELVSQIRAHPSVTGTETRIIAGRWWHGTNLDRSLPSREASSTVGSNPVDPGYS